MSGFCKHCGKELNGDEPYCPECGMPTGSDQSRTYYAPPKKNNGTVIAIAVVAVIAVLCIVGIALLPTLVDNTAKDKYTMTVTVNDFAIYLDDSTQYTDIKSNCQVILTLYYSYEGETQTDQLVVYNNYALNGGIKEPSNVKSIVKVTGDPKDVRISAYLMIRGYEWKDASGNPFMDYIDIYTVDQSKITSGSSLYFGNSGIVFDMSDLTSDGKIRLEGDSDPRGVVDLTVSSVKN